MTDSAETRPDGRWQVLVPVVAGFIIGAVGFVTEVRATISVGVVLLGIGGLLGVHQSVRSGSIRTNWGTFVRDQQPVRFWLEAVFWYCVMLVWIVAGVSEGIR